MGQQADDDKSTRALPNFWRWCAAVASVVALGLFVRFVVAGPIGDFLGGVLYTVLLAVLVFPLVAVALGRSSLRRRMRGRPTVAPDAHWIAAGVALAASVSIELLQLSSIPAQLSEVFPPARLVLGTSFAAMDLVAYCVGAVLAGAVGTLAAARAQARRSAAMPGTTSWPSEPRDPAPRWGRR